MEEVSNASYKEFLAKIERLKTAGGVDLSVAEDLSIGVMNLISLEEHFFFTGAKTGDGSYYDLSGQIREMRKKLLARLMDKNEGETWCISKHLLSGTMRLIEVGNKYLSEGEKEKAEDSFKDAYRLYTVFWALKVKLVKGHALKTTLKKGAAEKWSLETLVGKLADCCDE